MTLFKWPEEDLRQKFCKMTFKGLKTNPKPVKEEREELEVSSQNVLAVVSRATGSEQTVGSRAAGSSLKDKRLLTF